MQKPPRLFVWRGTRIRARNRSLVLRFALMTLTPLFLSVAVLLHLRMLMAQDWSRFSLPYFLISSALALMVCASAAFLYRRYRYDSHKQREHRQKLARLILDNGWCERERVGKRERIRRFARMWYRKRAHLVTVAVALDMGKHQEQLLQLETRLETGLYCELIDKAFEDGYLTYTLLYDSIHGRISIDKVTVRDGSMKLMETVAWAFDEMPHMLVAGGTGGGKTYFLLTIIYALLRQTNAVLTICDPKISALIDLNTILPDVYSDPTDITESLVRFHADMLQRYEDMKVHPNYETGKNYAHMGLEPHFFILDEFVAYLGRIGREKEKVLETLRGIAMMGRQAGYFLILACQRPDGRFLETDIRDQFNFRVALGQLSEHGYNMMFGDVKKIFLQKPIKGRGYYSNGREVIPEFYAPYVPPDFSFLDEIRAVAMERGDDRMPAPTIEIAFDEQEVSDDAF